MAEPRYRWVIVAAGAVLGCVALGAMFSLPVLIGPIAKNTGWTNTAVSSAMTIGFLTMAAGSFAWGTLSDRIGARWTCVIGSVLIGAGLLLASDARSVHGFQLAFGFLVGAGTSAIFAPTMACVTGWFNTHRSLAVSLVSAGFGVAPLTMSPWVAWLTARHDWREVLQIVAVLVLSVMVPVSLFIRKAPALQRVAAPAGAVAPGGALATSPSAMPLGELIRSPQFIVLALTNFFCCATHSGPIFHTVSYAVTCGIPLVTAVTIYSVEGLAGLGGRVAFGFAGDSFGARRMLIVGLLMQAVFALCYFFVNQLDAFYVVAALFGFTYGGTMPLYASLARENFPLGVMGAVIGGVSTAGSLGMASGPVLGGWLYDTFGSYGWLYLASCGFGIVAVLMAMAFTPREAPPTRSVIVQAIPKPN
jgi:MFS family permease